MKKIIPFLVLVLILFSCSKDSNTVATDIPLANAVHDNSGFGIYKGVFVGSSGTIIININNNNDNSQAYSAIIEINGEKYYYSVSQQTPVVGDQSFTIHFSSGSNSFDFNVGPFGTDPTVTNIIIDGHPDAAIVVIKELSTALVECFRGTYTGDDGDQGDFNIAISNGIIKGKGRSSVFNENFSVSGTILNGDLGGVITNGYFSGTRSSNAISGDWSNAGTGESGGWSGNKTYF